MPRFTSIQFEEKYDKYKMRQLIEDLSRQFQAIAQGTPGAGGGAGGAHNDLSGRDAEDAHPISAISLLTLVLDGKADDSDITALAVLISNNATNIASNDARITVLEGEVLAANAQRVDDTTSSTVYYFGEAVPGSVDTDSVWRVSRGTFVTPGEDDFELEWADGDNLFDNIWDDRLSLVYS